MSEIITRCWKISDLHRDMQEIKKAGDIINQGGLVAFPTETVYGLGANALDGRAVQGIFKAKGRPSDNPLIVHISNIRDITKVAATLPGPAAKLIDAFWPGPLTLVLPKTRAVPREVTAGLDTVAVRMPDHPVALALIAAAQVPVAAPSANRSGSPSPTMASHVLQDLKGRIHGVLDGGPANVGLESTVLDLTNGTPTILRPGGVTVEQLREAIGEVCYDPALQHHQETIKPRSPGMKYKHYSPKARLILLEGDHKDIVAKAQELLARYRGEQKKVGILTNSENAPCYQGAYIVNYGNPNDTPAFASTLYDALRRFDSAEVDVIIAEGIPATGLGRAVMDRLRRAAGINIIKV